MSEKDWLFRINDIRNAILNINNVVSGISFEDFVAEYQKWSSVSYAVVVIGEAVRYIPFEIKQKYPEGNWNRILGMRNRIAHDYLNVNYTILWDTIHNDLPALEPILKQILIDFSE